MNKSKARSILYAIKKIANDGYWDVESEPAAQKEPTWNTGGGAGGGGAGGGAADIKAMQQAIRDFASSMVKYKTKSAYDPQTKKMKEVVDQNDKRKDFNDFLAEQYSAGSSIKGQEWTTDVAATSREKKLPTDIIELDNVIDGLRRMGTYKNEAMIDGNWDWRTQNALKNVWAIADALVRVTDDFGAKLPVKFTRGDLQALANAVPKTNDIARYPLQNKIQSARVIKPLVEKLTAFYNAYYTKIIQSPEYSSYIKQDAPLVTVKPGGQNPAAIPRELQQVAQQNQNLILQNVMVPTGNGRTELVERIPIKPYLESKEGLQKLMLQLGYSPEQIYDANNIATVLKALLDHVDLANRQIKETQMAYSTTILPSGWSGLQQ